MHENACALLWSHAAITLDGKMQPCCRFDSSADKTFRKPPFSSIGFGEAWFSEQMEEIRQKMLAGEKIAGCAKCWEQETHSGKSMRTDFNNKYSKHIGSTPKLRFLEIGFSTHCNLACRMCDENASSTIYKINHPGEKVRIGFDLDIDKFDVDLDHLEQLKIVGGEPMMAAKHDLFLDRLLLSKCDLSKLTIIYHTNCTVKPSEKIIDYWKKMKKVRIVLSIDGVGRVNEVQRTGHRWEDLLDILNLYKQLRLENSNILIEVHTVVTVLNVFGFPELHKFVENEIQPTRWSVDCITNRPYLSISNMSDEKKARVKQHIKQSELVEQHRQQILGSIDKKREIEMSDDLISMHQSRFDEFSGQNIKDYL